MVMQTAHMISMRKLPKASGRKPNDQASSGGAAGCDGEPPRMNCPTSQRVCRASEPDRGRGRAPGLEEELGASHPPFTGLRQLGPCWAERLGSG